MLATISATAFALFCAICVELHLYGPAAFWALASINVYAMAGKR